MRYVDASQCMLLLGTHTHTLGAFKKNWDLHERLARCFYHTDVPRPRAGIGMNSARLAHKRERHNLYRAREPTQGLTGGESNDTRTTALVNEVEARGISGGASAAPKWYG